MVRPRYGLHPRLHVWGPLEARLQHADLVCLGGLNEGAWPTEPDADPWMSRPMRDAFGLPPHERRIGLAAHDFAQLFCAGEVLLTRAGRVGGTPTVPSRWLSRLANALDAIGGEAARAALDAATPETPWLGWQAALDAPDGVNPVSAPAPRPPVAARPRRLSVTQIETWMRDPYSIYARHILRLRRLDPIDADPGAAERGSFIHAALDAFVRANPDPATLPADAYARLLAEGRRAFGEALSRPGVAAFWWPRFERIAAWFVNEEARYREQVESIRTELRGEMQVEGPAGPFTLTAVADRIDRLKGGALSIIDYKTGTPPPAALVLAGIAPQLPLEAAIALAGGFNVSGDTVARLEFWRLSGGEPAGRIHPAGKDFAALAEDARNGLAALVARFDDPETPYHSHPDPVYPPPFPEYDHLARVQEWSVPGGDGGEGGA
jgi:ATP-dependent helicase/nuclease subunit B